MQDVHKVGMVTAPLDLSALRDNPDLLRLNPELLVPDAPKQRKYRNTPTVYSGRVYHSAKEAQYAAQLDLRVKAGEIVGWVPQFPIPLEGGTAIPVDLWNMMDADTVRCIVNVPGVPGVTGAGSLATLHFRAIGRGTLNLGLSNAFLNNNLAIEIPVIEVGDSVVIWTRGDVNNDGLVNAADITLCERVIVELDPWTVLADTNMDGLVNVADVTGIERVIVGLV